MYFPDEVNQLLREIDKLVRDQGDKQIVLNAERAAQFAEAYDRLLEHYEHTGVNVKYELSKPFTGKGNISFKSEGMIIYSIDDYAEMLRPANNVGIFPAGDNQICIVLTFDDLTTTM